MTWVFPEKDLEITISKASDAVNSMSRALLDRVK